jgi:hypothetical protein
MRKNNEQMEYMMHSIELMVKLLRFEMVLFTVGTMFGAIIVLLFSKLQLRIGIGVQPLSQQ